MNAAYRATVAAFWLLFTAAIVDHYELLAYAFGVLAIGVPFARAWLRWERDTRRYDSTRPPAPELAETLAEAAQTRRFGARKKESAA